jgi:16S rRNA (guanine1516-N2)-methyltransferase
MQLNTRARPYFDFWIKHTVIVLCNDVSHLPQAQTYALHLACPWFEHRSSTEFADDEIALVFASDGISLQCGGRQAPGPVRVDFVSGAVGYRRQQGSFAEANSLFAKAIGWQQRKNMNVLDTTAGMGQDAFVLAQLGCHVTLLERNYIVKVLLADGLRRASEFAREQDAPLFDVLQRMHLRKENSIDYLLNDESPRSDVIYLDPMFPERSKSAKVKKNMQIFHRVVGTDDDSAQLLELALTKAIYRVVVKRALRAPLLGDKTPAVQFKGKSVRFDVYPLRKITAD